MNKGLKALERLTNYKCSCMSEKLECKELIKKELKALEVIKDLFDIEIDIRSKTESSIIRLFTKSKTDRTFIYLCAISYTKAKYLKEVLL